MRKAHLTNALVCPQQHSHFKEYKQESSHLSMKCRKNVKAHLIDLQVYHVKRGFLTSRDTRIGCGSVALGFVGKATQMPALHRHEQGDALHLHRTADAPQVR